MKKGAKSFFDDSSQALGLKGVTSLEGVHIYQKLRDVIYGLSLNYSDNFFGFFETYLSPNICRKNVEVILSFDTFVRPQTIKTKQKKLIITIELLFPRNMSFKSSLSTTIGFVNIVREAFAFLKLELGLIYRAFNLPKK